MARYPFTAADPEAHKAWDTPTIRNALKVIVPARCVRGFSVRPLLVAPPSARPVVGSALAGAKGCAANGSFRDIAAQAPGFGIGTLNSAPAAPDGIR